MTPPRDLQSLSYLYPGHPLLAEIEKRDIALAQARRSLAAADKLIALLRKHLAQRKAEARQGALP